MVENEAPQPINWLNRVPHTVADDGEIQNYAKGVVTGVMQGATPNVVGTLLARIRADLAACLTRQESSFGPIKRGAKSGTRLS